MKEAKSKTLAREIDRIHGIEPALCGWIDCKISNITKSLGSTNVHTTGIQLRIDARSQLFRQY
jgi:hypothetical protein